VNNEILKTVLQEASALTASLPEGIQGVAFAKAFDVLLEERRATVQRQQRTDRTSSGGRLRAGTSRSRRVGPKLALGQLLGGGYFASSRSLLEIQAHLRDSYGHDYGSNELSISLLRLIRDGRLNRQRNLVGQYEYWAGERREQSARAEPIRRAGPNSRLLTDGGR
jgi:hypothetical protein